ncbi:hypothetical protein QYF61_009612, partial [Mycteria americana]
AERHTGVFMDIVDTFNHLIPTEHLDDALFLGSNLENEVCEDFSASQNVLEDSLKNMLSDKDPMLGSASAQFCLPVLDSNDPNFQMPCSTVIGLDDIMDEEGVKESGNDTIDEDELVLPNRNLRSRCEETSVTSPRKSPRLMAQEPVRSLRQSTLAKRSNVAPLVSTKKSSVKSGSAPKTGQKQERSPAKETDIAAPLKTEQPKEVRRSTRRSGQTEGTAAAVTASQSNTKCLPGPEELKEIKSETLEQAKVEETSQELSCANLAGACSPSPGGTKEITEVATKTESRSVESLCSVSAGTEIAAVKNEANDVIDSMGSETSSEEKTENKTEESEKKTEECDQSGVTGKANDPSSVCVNPREICETFSNLASSVEEGVDCSLGSHNVEVPDENTLSVKECVREPVHDDKGVEKTVTSSEKLLDSTEFDNKDLKSEEFTSADPGNSILDSTVLDQTSQNVQHQISSTKVEGPEASKFQDDDKQISLSSKCEKNVRPRHSKSIVQNKQNLTAGTRQKSGRSYHVVRLEMDVKLQRKSLTRFMVGCGRCDDWFHGDCVGLSLSQAQQMGEEDKEYVCVTCCAEEDKKMECFDQSVPDTQVKLEIHREEKAIECEKPGMSKQIPTCNLNVTTEKTKQMEDTGKHKVKIFRRESGDGKNLSESRDSDTKKGQHVSARKGSQTAVIPRRSPEDKNEKINKEALSVLERSTKSAVHEKQEIKKKKNEKGSIGATHLPAVPASKPSADQIRQSVKQSLKEILMKRLTDSSLKIPEERAAKVATRIERELFSFFRDTDSKYKNKYRSLMFNLKDPKNNILFKKVLKGEVTPDHLIKMSPEELASKELAAWRQRENRHTIEMIEKEQREVERRPITKITHKGEIEIESETPIKEQEEVMEIQEPNIKLFEKSEEAEKDKEINESASPDTTSQHKNHLFDLNCKICTGRMAPPTDDLSAKKVKVSVGVARKQSDNEAESIADALSSTSSILASELLEDDKQDSSKSSFTPLPKSETPGTVECESLFLARLNFIWKGFINMPSVAKFVIKAYPVSGSFEYLTEDLPDSIQVGGRISPHTVWEYVEKIKASGTKEICVVRFTPVTEEDQISYALLFAYFSSRKRYGVAANNMKQVKDLYLIPLGSSDKVPHHLVPFDGPGIEIHRPNLLLGLIIRQKMKRQITAVASVTSSFVDEASESTLSNLPPEKKSKPNKPEISHHELALEEEEENDFFNSFTTVLHKQRNKPQQSNIEDVPAVIEPLVESTKHEPPKPLRFLPGVLVGWENQPSTLELANKPLPVDDILQSLLGTTGQVYEHSKSEASPSEDIPLLNEQATLKEENMDVAEATTEVSEAKTSLDDLQESTNATVTVDAAAVGTSSSARSAASLIGLSLKGKPPDVSTEAFLANLSAQTQTKETEESKENDPKWQLPDKDNVTQEVRRTTNSSFSSSSSNAGKKTNENNVNVGSAEVTTANTSKSPPFINLKRDPRQAAGRSQQSNASENKEGDVSRNEDRQGASGNDQMEPENKQSSGEVGLNLFQSDAQTNETQYSSTPAKADNAGASQAEDTKHSQEDALMQNIETVNSFRRGPAATSSHFEAENSSRSEFISKVPSPITSGSFSSVRPPQQNFQHPKSNPPGFQFQAPAPHNFPPQNNPMFGFPPHLPPPLLPPPGFGFPQNPMMPWPPVAHLSGQPPHYAGPIAQGLPVAHKQSRFLGPENFFQSKDSRRPERRHSDPWGRQEQHLERGFSRGKNDQHRQRFYSESHHQKKDRHEKEWNNEKYWEQDSERNRRRDRTQEKERERKSREEGQRDKERLRSPHSDRAADGKSPRETRNPEKKTEKPKSEEQAHEKDKEREKSKEKHRERESEKNRERHRDHSDRTKSKR